jgi:formylglycine-generating enzyme required for sulfatase activity
MKSVFALALLLLCFLSTFARGDTFGNGVNTFTIEFVTIGNAGNAADTTGTPNPAGSVAYIFRMGQFEISEQMINKANAEGALGITKDTRGADKPATSVSWNEAARFVNWLNTSSGSPPAYKFAIQPGEAGYNATANIELWAPNDAGYDPNNLYRNSLARYFLPSMDEWYKAAYYDATAGVYYDYPTGSNSVPDGIDFAGDTTFDLVYYDGGPIPQNVQPNNITDVGLLSPYGTAGQGGNVWEWEETEFDLVNNNPSSSARGLRGGRWDLIHSIVLRATFREDGAAFGSSDGVGFRVASIIPEPSSALLAVSIFALLASCRSRR